MWFFKVDLKASRSITSRSAVSSLMRSEVTGKKTKAALEERILPGLLSVPNRTLFVAQEANFLWAYTGDTTEGDTQQMSAHAVAT